MSSAPRRQPSLNSVVIDDRFWSSRRDRLRSVSLPYQEQQMRTGGQFEALKLTWRPGDPGEPHIFWESDVAKWIEAASYVLARGEDAELDAAVDEATSLLAGAQQDDGYLNVYFTVVRPGERFTDLRDTHELYCAGHLIEAGVAHFEATGKATLLAVVRRYADLIDREFGPGGSVEGGYDGHQEIELALVKLFRATGERRYLDLALRFIDNRGTQPFFFDLERDRRGNEGYFGTLFPDGPRRAEWYREYNQSHLPVREQVEAVGHSVRAMYQYIAMADLAIETGDHRLRDACERLWEDVTQRKMYVTGGLGALPEIEGFGAPYQLPDADGYAETCAAIGLVFWAQRMTLLTGEARYADVLERALYNGVLSGASSDGIRYFYGNPLASDGSKVRSGWFECACCPPNLARLVSSLEYYAYAIGDDELTVNLYVGGSITFRAGETDVAVSVATGFPWNGDVRLTVGDAARFALRLRVPDWAGQRDIRVNGAAVPSAIVDGYVRIERDWSAEDAIEVHFPMEPTRLRADRRVRAVDGRIALRKGPFIHCAEETDNTAPIPALAVRRDAGITTRWNDELAVEQLVVPGEAERLDDALYTSEPPDVTTTDIVTLPYFAWGNRGTGSMAVWIREAAAPVVPARA